MAQPKVVKNPRRRNMGPVEKINHPFKILGQIFKFMSRHYAIHLIIVLICIVASVFANVLIFRLCLLQSAEWQYFMV